MKALFLFLAASGGLLSCRKETATGDVAAAVNRPFTLEASQTAAVPVGGGSTAHVALSSIYDSRCPTGVSCIWGGYAAVEVTLTDAMPTPQKLRISLGYKSDPTAAADSALVMLNQQTYWLRLLAVNPYPSRSGPSQPKVAILRLRPR